MTLIERFEAFLRIPQDIPAERLIRYRAIWLIGLMFVLMEAMNQFVMSLNYRHWTYDHWVGIGTMIGTVALVLALRWYKNPHAFTAAFAVLLFGGITGSALPQAAGVNTALLPLLILGPLLSGYISGPKGAVWFWGAATCYLLFLGWVTLTHPVQWASGERHRDINRMANAFFIMTLSTFLSAMLVGHTTRALKLMREAADRAARAEAAQSDFLAKMSHELRTPLHGVIGLTDVLLKGRLAGREREIAETVKRSGNSLLMILNDLLDLSKIEAGKMTITPRPVHLRETLDQDVQGWAEVAATRGIGFDVELSDDLNIGVLLDPLRLRQVIHNLLSNAVKFTSEGVVRMSAEIDQHSLDPPDLLVRISDTGVGIPADAVERIFEAFEQEEQAGGSASGGTGLGLPISRMLMELMGGSIGLERSGPDGSVFYVRLPLTLADIPEDQGDDTSETEADFSLRALVVEDHEVNKLVLGEYLRILGVEFEIVEDGLACLQRLAETNFDLVLMDKNMPRLNGLETTRAIRQSGQHFADIFVIAVTADAMVGERERLLAGGMDDFLSKPLQIDELVRVLQLAAERKAAS